jgi:hypothetical protein
VAEFGGSYAPVPLVREGYRMQVGERSLPTEWSRGVVELAEAIAAKRPQRVTGAQAAHVVEICEAISTSLREGRGVAVESQFVQPTPLEWAL